MSEMVDRVSAALAQSFKDAVAAGAEVPFGQTGVTLPSKAVWDRYAAVAIEAMRKPTEAMEDAADVSVHSDFYPPGMTWYLMIDEALK